MRFSIFAAMSRLKVFSKTWTSLPIIPSTERKMDKIVYIGHGSAACDFPSSIYPTKEKYYPLLVSSKSPPHHLQTGCQLLLLYGSPIGPGLICNPMFLECSRRDAPPPIIFCVPGVLGFFTCAVRVEVFSGKVNDIITYLILECNEKTSVAAAEHNMHIKFPQATVTFILKVSGG